MKLGYTRRIALPLAAVVGAGALAMASGSIQLSSASSSDAGVTLVAEDDHSATITVTDLRPGESATRQVTIRNSSQVDSRLSFTETAEAATFGQGNLELLITRDGTQVFDGQFGAMADFTQDMGPLAAGDATTFTFVVSYPDGAPMVRPDTQTATASYTWATTTP